MLALLALASGIACGVSGVGSAPTSSAISLPTATATATASPTKLVTSPSTALPPPTYARWAIDKGRPGDPARPYLLELFFDGGATSFRIVDAGGAVVLRLPIAGSGVFDKDTCMVRVPAPGKSMNATWMSIDEATYQRLIANAATYRVEADAAGAQVVTLPLEDTGCRPR